MRYRVAIAAVLFPTVALAWPWSNDMMDQPSVKPQEGTMTPFPERSIPVQGMPTRVSSREEAKSLESPIPANAASIRQGRTLFKVYCSACHGLTGKADSPISSKIGAISLVDSYVQDNLTEGWVFGTITFGSYVMPAYGRPAGRGDSRGSNDLTVEERWHVVNYVKHQLANDAESGLKKTAATD